MHGATIRFCLVFRGIAAAGRERDFNGQENYSGGRTDHPGNSLGRRGFITTDWICFSLLNFRLCYSDSAYSYGSYINQQMHLMQGYSK